MNRHLTHFSPSRPLSHFSPFFIINIINKQPRVASPNHQDIQSSPALHPSKAVRQVSEW